MTKSQFMRIGLIAASLLILIGVSLMIWMYATEDERNVIKVDIGDGSTQSIAFENLCLVPGESCEYTVKLKGDRSKKYDLRLDFVELEDETLKNFARVKIEANGEIVCDDLLATAFEKKDLVLSVDFKENRNTEFSIVYYLPVDVGNEAKNAEALFELQLTASNE